MKILFFKLLILAGVVLSVLSGIHALYTKTYLTVPEAQAPLWYAPSIEQPYQLVAVGNSHAESGLVFDRYKQPSLNMAGVAQRFDFDLALLKHNAAQIADNAIIIISVTPISFSHRPVTTNDSLQSNYYNSVVPWLIPNLNLHNYIQAKIIPSSRAGYLFRQRYGEIVRDIAAQKEKRVDDTQVEQQSVAEGESSAAEITGATAPTIPPETAAPVLPLTELVAQDTLYDVETIIAELASSSATSAVDYRDNMNFVFNKWYTTDEFSIDHFVYNRAALEKMIAYCLEQGWRPVLVTIPISQALQDGLLDDYMDVYLYDNLEQTETSGVEYLDFSKTTAITQDFNLFGNVDHLNERGAQVFSYLLLQTLKERGYLTQDEYEALRIPSSL